MAESRENSAEEAADQEVTQAAPQRQAPPPVELDDSRAQCCYANFCRVTGTPEELIIDFGLNPNPFGGASKPVPVTQRIICNLYTAKRMLHVLQLTVQRHEAAFGAVETDVQRRAANRRA